MQPSNPSPFSFRHPCRHSGVYGGMRFDKDGQMCYAGAHFSPCTPWPGCLHCARAMSPTARLRLALATGGAALALGAALFAGRPTSEPAATVAPSPARPSVAAVDAKRETSTHMTAGGSPVRWAREDNASRPTKVRTIYFVLWGGSEADVALVTAMNHGIRVWN